MTLVRYMFNRSISLIGVLFATLLITILLIGPTANTILEQQIIRECNDEANKIKFPTPNDRAEWVEKCIKQHMEAIGLHKQAFAVN